MCSRSAFIIMMLFLLFVKITQPLWEKYTKEVIEQHERELKEYEAAQESDPISSIPSTYKPNQNTTYTNISPPEKAISKEFVDHDSDDSASFFNSFN
uniref:Uncharacterized protein n=1 Tax=Ditylenchus dipsaci TaxID=166011 RepID=A0A915E4U6_9BILA